VPSQFLIQSKTDIVTFESNLTDARLFEDVFVFHADNATAVADAAAIYHHIAMYTDGDVAKLNRRECKQFLFISRGTSI
jgi:hypothetical protein